MLIGERDSLSNDETLVFLLNDREYYSQGLQTKLAYDSRWRDFDLIIDAGVRIHQDQVQRRHRERYLVMRSGNLERTDRVDQVITRNKDDVTALAGFTNIRLSNDKLNASLGFRIENIDGESQDFLTNNISDNSDTVILPGAGIFYQLTPEIGVLAGVNKGYVPNSPGQQTDIDPEECWNYELGLRANVADWNMELIGFFNDYSNLIAVCTLSSGSECNQHVDTEFNGGEVDIYGAEASLKGSIALTSNLNVPVSVAYTFTESEFKTSFQSDFGQWGTVEAGDELPYVSANQLNVQVGLEGQDWSLLVAYKYIDDMREAAGRNVDLQGVFVESLSQLDIAGYYQLNDALRLYAKLDNATDEAQIVSRRPFGARPGKPRQFIFGAKYQF